MTLAETQELFHAAITGEGASPGAIESCFTGTDRLPPGARVGIYADMWLWRQVDALAAEFPALAEALGQDRFAALCRDYLRAHPSEHHDIGRLGRHLAGFLRLHPADGRPELGDLAELEWARSEVFFEAPAEAVGREALAALDQEKWGAVRLRLVPALRLLALAHPAHQAWSRAMRGGDADEAPAAPARLAVWRAGYEVFHAPLDPEEAEALGAAMSGASLLEICARFGGAGEPAAAAAAALSSWFDEGWVAGVT